MRNELDRLLASVPLPDAAAGETARARWDALAKPLGSLGLLEDAVAQIAALTGSADVCLDRRTLLVFCADNGVVQRGVTQCGSAVTASVAGDLAAGHSAVSPMARLANCEVLPVDVGMATEAPVPGVPDRRVQTGTNDISTGPAMTRDACRRTIETGAALAMEQARQGVRILLVGEMGIGNTTTAAAVAAALLELDPENVVGRGAGLSDAGLSRKREVVRAALRVNQPDAEDPVDVLAKVGGLDLAAMCGAYLGAAAARLPVLMDGSISSVAALCAVRLCPAAAHAILASHVSPEPAAQTVLDALGKRPLLTAGLRLGEGSGAVAALPLLDMALAVYHSGETFARRGIEPYKRLS